MKWAILTLISIFICVCCSQMLEWDQAGNLIAHHYSIWGDWSAHFTFISSFMNRGIQWISGDNPVFYGMPFQYPFLSHGFTAIISSITPLNMVNSTYYISLALMFTLPFVLFNFFKVAGLTVRQAILAVILFLFLGGIQAFDSTLNPAEPFTNQFKGGSVFTQIILFELFPQRAFLFGMILLLLGVTESYKKIKLGIFNRAHFIFFALYFSFLSWMHLHSWITISSLILVYFVFSLKNKNALRIFLFGLGVLCISAPMIYFLLLRSNHSSEVNMAATSWQKWFPGWAQNPNANLPVAESMNPIIFWIYNTGIFLPMAAIGKFLLWKKKLKISESPIFILGTTGGILFIIAMLFNIQPYYYDNLKIFTYAFLLLAPFAALGVDSLFQKKYLIPIGLILIIFQSYTGFQDYLFFYHQKQTATFLTHEEFELSDQFKGLRRSPDSLVLIAPKHNHWIPTLTGNPILMGYPGWLWSWGISYSAREIEVNEILSGGQNAMNLLAKYPIEYIVVNEQEMAGKVPVSMTFLKSHFQILMEHGLWHVFKIK